MHADPIPLTPEARALDDEPRGTPATLADGRDWTLSAEPATGDVWDDLYDHNVARGRYEAGDVLAAAHALLRRNYAVTPDEAYSLLRDVEPAALVGAVEASLLGSDRENWTRSMWVEASLLLAGVDPATAPPRLVRMMLDILERTRRTLPEAEAVSVQAAMAKRNKILNFGKD